MTTLQDITTGFREAFDAINQKRNIKLRAGLNRLFENGDYLNDIKIASTAVDLTAMEVIERSDELCVALFDELDAKLASLAEGEALTLRTVHQGALRDCVNQIRNELFRHYEPFPRTGQFDDGYIVSVLAEGVNRAEAAAFTDAAQKLKRVYRKAGINFDSTPPPAPIEVAAGPDASVFVDTNLFLQYRDLKDFPWQEILPAAEWIEIAVAKVIVDELDHHKNQNVRRRRDRSRAALKRIGEAAKSEGGALELRPADPRVTLRFVLPFAPDPQKVSNLDLTTNDNRFVAAFIEGRSRGPSKLMSDDSGPRLTALTLGYGDDVIEPLASWRLPEEPDIEAQKLKDLTKELAQLKAAHPEISIECAATVNWILPDLEPLDDERIEALMSRVMERHPRAPMAAANLIRPSPRIYLANGFHQHQVDAYNNAYDAYLASMRSFFQNAHKAAVRYARTRTIPVLLTNQSHNTAHNVLMELAINNKASLLATKTQTSQARGATTWPKPPKIPTLPHEARSVVHTPLPHPLIDQNPKNLTRFYWQDTPSFGSSSGSLICQEFRANEQWRHPAIVTLPGGEGTEYTLAVRVTATNLRSAVQAETKIHLRTKSFAWSDTRIAAFFPATIYNLICPKADQQEDPIKPED